MLKWVLRFSLQYRSLVLAGAAVLMLVGAYRVREASVDVLPEFSAPVIQIQTEALGLSAAEVEDLITLNLEEMLASVSWLKSIRSKSITGLSSIVLAFQPGTDLMRARQLVQERLNLAHALPNVSKPPVMLQPVSTTSRAMIVGLSPKEVSLVDASVLARWTITPKLLGVRGVANVSVWGMRSRQLQVQVDTESLRDKGVTLAQVVKTAGDAMWVSPLSFLEASTPGTGGWIDTPNQRLGIQHVQPITSPSELAKVAIADKSLRLGDVASVVEEHPPLIGDAIINGKPGLLLVVEKFPDANALEVVRGVDAALNELRQGLPGIEIDTSVFRATNFIDLAIDNLAVALLVGAGLLVIALGVWFSSWRAALISIVAIALSLVTVGFILCLRGMTINVMVLAGFAIALTAIIGDAVIDIENIMRRTRWNRRQDSDRSTAQNIFTACAESRSPMMYAMLILVLATVPLFLMDGPLGAFVGPLAVTYVLALLVSTAVAMTVTPALAIVVMRGASLDRREPLLVRWLQHHHRSTLSRVLGEPRAALLAIGVVIVAGTAILPALRWSPLPSFKQRDVRVSWEAPPGTGLAEMRRITTKAAQELRQIPGVRNVAAHIGRAVTGDQVVGIESAQLWVSIDPNADYEATLAATRDVVQGYPGFDGEVQTYLGDRVKGVLTGSGDPIVARIQGPEREVLRREAEKVATVLSQVPGIINPRVEGQVEVPHLEIKVNLAAAGRVGLKPGDVRRAAATVFAGLEVGSLFKEQKVFEVVVWGASHSRQSLTNLREFLIDTPDDGHVRLADVAEVDVVPAAKVIEREGVSRRIEVRANVRGREVGSVVADVKQQLQQFKFPLEYHSVLLADYEEQAAHWQILTAAFGVAIGIYLLLQACFQSWRLASLLLLSFFATLSGGVLGTFAADASVSLGSLAGGLAMLGIAARDGILLINRYQHLEREEREVFGSRVVLRGTSERLVAILASATAQGAVLLPLIALGNVAGLEILRPIVAVILGGLVVSVFINLFIVPSLYLLISERQQLAEIPARHKSDQHA
jgi:CzcA family heavy metal efflux pump